MPSPTPATTRLMADIVSLTTVLGRVLPEHGEERDLLAACLGSLRFMSRHLTVEEMLEEATFIRDTLLTISMSAQHAIA